MLTTPVVTPSVCRQLYTKFKEDNSESWQEVLELYDLVQSSESTSQTVAQRTQSFDKMWKWFINLVSPQIFSKEILFISSKLEGAAVKHGFEAAVVMCGKVVNEDASLAFTHTTARAKKVTIF